MAPKLKDKVALITGSARGIGYAIARLFASEGASIVLSDVNEATLKEAEKGITELGAQVISVKVDVTNEAEVEGLVKKTIDKFGKVDILVNNAGITKDGLLMRMPVSDWDAVLSVNLKGAFLCTKAVSRIMIKQRSGTIVNMASIIGLMGNPGQANYAASKGGLISLTKTAAKEFASRGIRVNAIAPGFIRTDMTDKLPEDLKKAMLSRIPLNKFGETNDVAKAALFLAGEESDYITGCTIRVDGGMAI
ncbi:MAG: 3-oxoacyl-[acyl-carrier-protein] reductase [Candidatus Omnitrophica bacterium]|nr:3-oxoacyl-[acyl-carrier-protein] reductase [Candidatus Omnitrophota bacterium]